MSAQLYQGTLNGSLSAQAAHHPVFTVKQSLAGVAVGPLLREAGKRPIRLGILGAVVAAAAWTARSTARRGPPSPGLAQI